MKTYSLDDVKQGSLAWKMLRLGKITSSNVYCLMSTPRGGNELFTETAKSYLYGVASELMLNKKYSSESFMEEYFERVDATTRQMRYGTELELKARVEYAKAKGLKYELKDNDGSNVSTKDTGNGSVIEVGFVEGEQELTGYGDSPDGLILNANGNVQGCLEIKCPNPATFAKYKYLFEQGKTLKEIEPKYYWQVVSHCLANNVEWCDFVFYDKMMRDGLQIKRIEMQHSADGFDDLNILKAKIKLAVNFVNSIVSNDLIMS
jgi:hypothetical protein